jgi:drug/metabolite transporter (DMT)-like permease
VVPREHRLRLLAAFAAIYLIWGSTYLAIRYAVATIPPYLMAGTRFGVAGLILLAVSHMRGAAWPTGRQWGVAFVSGTLLLAGGIGSVSWAEQRVPSGLAALVAGAVPLVTVVVDWLRPGGSRPDGFTMLGLLAGFAGVVLLINPGANDAARIVPAGAGILVVAVVSWACGTVFSRHVHGAPSPLMGAGASMLMGSLSLFGLATLLGETAHVDLGAVSLQSLAALSYLVVFGSVLAFTAYFWLIKNTTPAKAMTYAYVNPVLALLLGWAVEGEPVTARVVLAASVILAGVLVVTALPHARTWLDRRPRRAPPGAVEDGSA